MKLSRIFTALGLISPLVASPAAKDNAVATTFNGEEVPPMLSIKGDEINATIAKGNWWVTCHLLLAVYFSLTAMLGLLNFIPLIAPIVN